MSTEALAHKALWWAFQEGGSADRGVWDTEGKTPPLRKWLQSGEWETGCHSAEGSASCSGPCFSFPVLCFSVTPVIDCGSRGPSGVNTLQVSSLSWHERWRWRAQQSAWWASELEEPFCERYSAPAAVGLGGTRCCVTAMSQAIPFASFHVTIFNKPPFNWMNMILFVLLVNGSGVLGWVGGRGELPVRIGLLQGKAPASSCADPSLCNRSRLGLGPSTGSPPVIRDRLTDIHALLKLRIALLCVTFFFWGSSSPQSRERTSRENH